MRGIRSLFCYTMLASSVCGVAAAQSPPPGAPASQPDTAVSEVIVTADPVRLIEVKPNATVFGLGKPLLETPRSATLVSDTTMERYGITSIDDLVKISPNAYTASFYGVPGAVDVRGTLAENYFKGFKRVENRGTYATPIGDASQIEVVRGPPTPIYGPGKVGGFLNFVPKSARDGGAYLKAPTGEAEITVGSYQKKDVTLQGGTPVSFGPASGGVYGFFDADDGHSYYRGIYPSRQTLEGSAAFDLPQGWSTGLDVLIYHSDGDVQTAGWNRLTQDLINNGAYITGRDTTVKDINGDGRLQPGEIGFYPYSSYLYCVPSFFLGCNGAGLDPKHSLDVGVGTTKLSPRTVYISAADFSRTTTYTVYSDIAKQLNATDSLKLEYFYDALNNERFVSYGFPASYQSFIMELRGTYNFENRFADGLVTSKSFVGFSHRYTHGHRRESFNSGVIALDRRDIAFGATATDILDSPFSSNDGGQQGLQWENDIHSNVNDEGLFLTTDITIAKNLDLILGGRYDFYNIRAKDVGLVPYEAVHASNSKGAGAWTASLTYKLPYGLMPYYTYARASALEIGQAGDVPTSILANNGYVSASHLAEAGVKFTELNNTLVGSLGFYRQDRTSLRQGGGVTTIQGTRSTGVELEVRYLLNRNFSFTFAGNSQHTEVKGPDHSFVYLPAAQFGVSGANGFGGTYVTFDFTSVHPGDYEYTLVPHSVASLYGTFTSDPYAWGRWGGSFGGTYVSKTSTYVTNPIQYPDYAIASLSLFISHGPYTLSGNVDNLFDKLYFTPDADSYANLGALPSIGREWRIKLARKF